MPTRGRSARGHDALWEEPPHADYGYGGILCVDLGSAERANRFMELLQNVDRFGFMAVSLGYFETLLTLPASSTSSELDEGDLSAAGISPGLVRISIGYTGSVEQRWSQMEDVLKQMGLVPSTVGAFR